MSPPSTQTGSIARQLLFAVFLLSGFTGLIYESIWSHYLKLFLGHAAYAQTLVLIIFMGGLALGSALAARYCGRLRNLLLGYALLEALIGVLALLFDRTYGAVTEFALTTAIPALGSLNVGSLALAQAFKWLLGALLILPQAVLLGMTFPLISAGIIRRFPARSGETLAMLYFTNSLGAALGVLVSGFVLIAALGLPGTIAVAGVLNLLLAVPVWLAVRARPEPPVQAASATPTSAQRSTLRWMLLVAGFTGAASFFYEIAWIRLLSLVLGSATHSFELMLSAFILGLGLGSMYVRRMLDRHPDPFRLLAKAMAATALAALVTVVAYNHTFDVMAVFMSMFTPTPQGFVGFNLASHGIAIAIMVPATFFAGMTLPIMTHILLRLGGGERAIGNVYAANTLGAIIGITAAVHVVMPVCGVKGLIVAGAAVHLALAFASLRRAAAAPAPRWLATAAATGAVMLITASLVRFDPLRMTSAVYRTGAASQDDGARVLYLRDGKTATISLLERDGQVSIATNGKPDALIKMSPGMASIDEVTMTLIGALPLMLHPQPQRIANIGIGAGMTSQVLLESPRVQHLDSIEIEARIVEAARIGFMPRVRRLFEDPRSRIVVEDAKTFFALEHARYDVIVSEPSNPWVSGVATLFSEEFYRRLVHHLNEGGLLVQWLQIYETDLPIVASVAQAMAPYFKDYALFHTDDGNVVIIACKDRMLPALGDAVFSEPDLAQSLARIGVTSLYDVEKRRLGNKRSLHPLFLSVGVPANSDFYPYVDLHASKARFTNQSAIELTQLNLLPVPVTQLLEAAASRHARPPAPTGPLVDFDRATHDAITLQAAVLNQALEAPVRSTRLAITANMQPQPGSCSTPAAQKAWRTAVKDIALETSQYLSAAELGALWQHMRAHTCYGALPAADRQFLALLEAVARRDRTAIIEIGSALLSANDPRPTEELAYILSATAATLLGEGHRTQAQQVLAVHFPAAMADGQYALALRMLVAMVLNAPSDG